MILRLCLDIVLLGSVLFLNMWVTLILTLIGLFVFRNFYEAIAAGVIMDLLYGTPLARFDGFSYISTALAIFMFAMLAYIRRRLRIHERLP